MRTKPLLAAVASLVVLAAGCSSTPSSGPAAGSSSGPAAGSSSGPATGPSSGPASRPPSGPASGRATSAGPTPAPAAAAEAADPACTIPEKFAGKDLERLPVSEKVVALTFDAGANSDAVPSILATLADRKVPGTFFLTGRFVEDFPKRAARIAHLYPVGNHTMSHPDLTTLGDVRVRRQVLHAEQVIRDTTGQDPRRFFRFPYGARDARTIKDVNALCYVAFRWTVDSLGWKGTSGGMTVQKVADRVVAAATPGAIVLMHVGSNPDDGTMLDAAALPQVITRLRAKGYTFVRLSRVMSAAP